MKSAPPSDRQCALSGRSLPSGQLVRIVYNTDFGWCVDQKAELPGDGWWILPSDSLITAKGHEVFVLADANFMANALIELIDQHLLRQIQSLLSLAKRATATVVGGERIKRQVIENSKELGLLLRAYDGGSGKFWHWLERHHQRQADFSCLSQQELAAPFGREALGSVHVHNYGFCIKIRQECQKMQLIRTSRLTEVSVVMKK